MRRYKGGVGRYKGGVRRAVDGGGWGGRGEIRSVLGEDVDEMGYHVALPRVRGHHGFNLRVRKRKNPPGPP